MTAKQMLFNDEAWRALERGVNKVAMAVRATLGPRGRNVVLEKKWGSPTITNDGVTIAKEIDLEDPFENMGAQLLKEIASKTMTSRATERPQPQCWGKRYSRRGLRTSFRARIRWH